MTTPDKPKRGPGRPPKQPDPRLQRPVYPISKNDHDKMLRLVKELGVALNVGTRGYPGVHKDDLRRIDDAAEEIHRLVNQWQGKR